jgi:FkbM family methyltransferase
MIAIPRSIARIPLLRGLVRVALGAWADLFYGRYIVERRQGLTLLLDRSNAVDRQLHVSGAWEPRSVERLFRLVEAERRDGEGSVFLDVGAHWAFYALLAHKSGRFERIVALEPSPDNFAQLQANLFLNDAARAIEALPLAASDREGIFGLKVDSRNRGGTMLVEAAAATVTCRAARLDGLLDVSGKLLVVKIDVETHEEQVLDGLLTLLDRNRSVLQIEIWTGPESRDHDRPRRVIDLLARHGIKLVDTFGSDYFFVSGRGS